RNVQIRIGMNSGKVVAGVIGKQKYCYDLWGNTVNVASRMESTGIPGKIQVSRDTYVYLYEKYLFKEREIENVKGVGNMKAYIFEPRKVPKSETVNIENTIVEHKSENLLKNTTSEIALE